ncbi:hypothetical protein [Rhizomicrobium electricum]|uniref:Uncharacterized protein n=1 Tax=Rhizomicrobium electricum TaxID=480070 RepID=A0ABP3QAG3_9PROT|nr:hypothetical protein [Rhizomicrobium electricum]NIJ50550.1 hypothetical protein [Rhizomicrobium electricum]
MNQMISYIAMDLAIAALLALVCGVVARKVFRANLKWAVVVGVVVLVGLALVPIKTHAVAVDMPVGKSN